MKLVYKNPGIDYMVDSIMKFQKEEESAYWMEPLYYFYPQIKKEYAMSLSSEERYQYIKAELETVYKENEEIIKEKITAYNKRWKCYENQITEAFSDAFLVDCSNILNDMVAYISLNPISPRFLETNSFEVFYLNSEVGALGASLHEIVHLVWFYVWNQVFGDSYEEYERPNIKWILSEMVVEAIMSDTRLSSINPYFDREKGGCVYPYFFTMNINGECILDTLKNMYQKMPMIDFMKEALNYCTTYENEIRIHMEESEKVWGK